MGRANFQPVNPTERVRELTWAMVDEHLEDTQWGELQKLLSDSSDARLAYIDAMQLHTDLLFHFKDQLAKDSKDTPILGSLGHSAAAASPAIGIGG